jgi:hypothetical protein
MTDQQTQARAAWMQRLFRAYMQEPGVKVCPSCGYTLNVVSDSFLYNGVYKVSRSCGQCKTASDYVLDAPWVARTMARLRRTESNEQQD